MLSNLGRSRIENLKKTVMLNAEEAELLRNYQYKGGDSSPVYKLFLSPFAQFCVEAFTPRWVAPNVLTLLGLLLSLLSVIITLTYDPSLSGNAPAWVHLLTGINIFAYQTLDNMDGKQARRTGSSSALGMFFDHACDSINAGLTLISMGSAMGTGWTAKFFLTYWASFPAFYGQTWEEYYIGAMVLPPFNGPSEGLLMSVITCFISAYKGADFFSTELYPSPSWFVFPEGSLLANLGFPSVDQPVITPRVIMIIIVTCAVVGTAIEHVHSVFTKIPSSRHMEAFSTLFPFLAFFPGMFYYALYAEFGFRRYPIIVAILYCAIFAESVMVIMIAHLLHRKINILERHSLWLFILQCALSLMNIALLKPWELALLFINTSLAFVNMISLFVMVCGDFADVLDIHIFRLGKRSEQQQKHD